MKARRFNKVQKRKISIFFRCIIISFVAWLLIAISNKYIMVIKVGVAYVGVPERRAFHPLQSDTVSVQLKMSGWEVLLAKLNPIKSTVEVDLSTLSSRNFIVFNNQLGFINRQFPADKQVIKVSPDTLYFDFSKQRQRKVRVHVPTNLTFKKQYGIIGEARSNPEYVTITGPTEDVSNIDFLETDTVYGTLVGTDIRTVANINRQHRANITVYPTIAEITIPVGEMTEKQIEVPLTVLNSKKYTSVRIVPSKVTITALVSLKDYAQWSARDFKAIVDLEDWSDRQISSLPVKVIKIPPYSQIIRIEPQNIDFFVRK